MRTGEAVAIHYELAGLGSRFLAVIVDLVLQICLTALLAIALAFAEPVLARLPLGKNLEAWAIGAAAFVLFLIFFGWFIIFETWWSGRTPGKRALGLRVVRDGGFPVDAGASVIRNVVRIVEFALGFYAISAVSALISRENKRLGDFAAGTIVVRDRGETVADLDAYLAGPARGDTGLTPADHVLIDRFLARRATLDRGARAQLAARIVDHVQPRLRADYGDLTPEALLEVLAGR